MGNKSIIWIVVAISCVLFALFVWPTIYRYDHVTLNGNIYPVRINRLSGESNVIMPSEWQSENKSQELSSEELSLLKVEEAKIEYGSLKVELYNGTSMGITEILIEIKVVNQDGTGFVRQYKLFPNSSITPPRLMTWQYWATTGLTLHPGQVWYYRIISAKGEKSNF